MTTNRKWNSDCTQWKIDEDDGPAEMRFAGTLSRFIFGSGPGGNYAGFEYTPTDPEDAELVAACKTTAVNPVNLRCATNIGLGNQGQLAIFLNAIKAAGWDITTDDRMKAIEEAKEGAKKEVAEKGGNIELVEETLIGKLYARWLMEDAKAQKFAGMKAIVALEKERKPMEGKAPKLRLRIYRLEPQLSEKEMLGMFAGLENDLGAIVTGRGKQRNKDEKAAGKGNTNPATPTDPTSLNAANGFATEAPPASTPKW